MSSVFLKKTDIFIAELFYLCYTIIGVMYMTVGERIRSARGYKALTQKQLGEKSGIAEPTIRKYELGKLNPKRETLQKIANALDMPISYFTGSAPFNDIEMLFEFQGVILHSLYKNGFCEEVAFPFDISDYDYLKLIASHISNIENDPKNKALNIEYKMLDGSINFNNVPDKPVEEMTPDEVRSALNGITESFKKFGNDLNELYSDHPGLMLYYFDKLNQNGKKEAVKRVSELTEIPRFQKPEQSE